MNNPIHVSQVPQTWQGTATYTNDLMYEHIPNNFNFLECKDYLQRKIKQLNAKIEEGGVTRHMSRWQNQRDMYEAILYYLSLRKQL